MIVFFTILAVLLLINILLFQFNTGASSKSKIEPEFEVEKKSYPKPHLV